MSEKSPSVAVLGLGTTIALIDPMRTLYLANVHPNANGVTDLWITQEPWAW